MSREPYPPNVQIAPTGLRTHAHTHENDCFLLLLLKKETFGETIARPRPLGQANIGSGIDSENRWVNENFSLSLFSRKEYAVTLLWKCGKSGWRHHHDHLLHHHCRRRGCRQRSLAAVAGGEEREDVEEWGGEVEEWGGDEVEEWAEEEEAEEEEEEEPLGRLVHTKNQVSSTGRRRRGPHRNSVQKPGTTPHRGWCARRKRVAPEGGWRNGLRQWRNDRWHTTIPLPGGYRVLPGFAPRRLPSFLPGFETARGGEARRKDRCSRRRDTALQDTHETLSEVTEPSFTAFLGRSFRGRLMRPHHPPPPPTRNALLNERTTTFT